MAAPAKTNYGAIGLLLAIFLWALALVGTFGNKLFKPDQIQRISNFIFDFGFIIGLLSLTFAVAGLFKGGRSRWHGAVAILLVILPAIVIAGLAIFHR